MTNRRLFLALPVEAGEEWARAFREAVERAAGPACARRLRYVAPAEWHLTLCFLGATPADRVPDLARATAEALDGLRAPRVVELAGGAFPPGDDRPARVLWLGPREAPGTGGRIAALAAACRSAAARALGPDGLPPGHAADAFSARLDAFTPHLTGARVPRGARGPSREGRAAFEAWRTDVDWRPREVALYESRGDAGPSRYRVLERVFLPTDGPDDEKVADRE